MVLCVVSNCFLRLTAAGRGCQGVSCEFLGSLLNFVQKARIDDDEERVLLPAVLSMVDGWK